MDKFFYIDKLVMQDHLNGNDYKETAINQDELVMKKKTKLSLKSIKIY